MRRISRLSTILFLVSIISLPLSFPAVRGFFVMIFLVAHLYMVFASRKVDVYFHHAVFYFLLIIIGFIWSFIGLVHGNNINGVIATLKLYGAWSIAYLLIITLIRNYDRIEPLHTAMIWSGIVISLINIFGVVDAFLQLSVVTESIRQEMGLYFGFDENYIKIHSNNIASLFFVVPYLIATYLRRGNDRIRSAFSTISLVLSLVVVVISGRRALWLCVAFTPILILALSAVADGTRDFTKLGARFLKTYLLITPLAALGYLIVAGPPVGGASEYLSSAFSAGDERTIQKGFLYSGFRDYPTFGSGFGASAGYLRNADMPWLYELSYHQILFNFGVIGSVALLAGLLYYTYLAGRSMERCGGQSPIPFGILVGFYGMLIGAYSNPIFGYFDSLMFVGLLVYLATLCESSPRYTLRLGSWRSAPVSG